MPGSAHLLILSRATLQKEEFNVTVYYITKCVFISVCFDAITVQIPTLCENSNIIAKHLSKMSFILENRK